MVVLSRMWVKRPPIGAKHPNSTKYSEIFFMWYHYQVIVWLDIEVACDICQLLTLCIRRNEYFFVLHQSPLWSCFRALHDVCIQVFVVVDVVVLFCLCCGWGWGWGRRKVLLHLHLFVSPSMNFLLLIHYTDVIMGAMASRITSLTIVCSTVYSCADQRNIKVPRHRPLCGEFTGDRWIPRTNVQ